MRTTKVIEVTSTTQPNPAYAGLEIQDFVDMATEDVRNTPGLRYGQALYNRLSLVRPDLTYKVTGTDLDPFYSTERLPMFLSWLNRNW